jgi:hypothetical protein
MIELIVVILALGAIALMLVPVLKPRKCCGSRSLKDSIQIRHVHQGFVLWSQGDNGRYPLPSRMDVANATVDPGDAPAESKDTTANIMSAIVYAGFISPELLVSPAEQNPNVVPKSDYALSNPPGAPSPSQALWDPTLRANLESASTSHVSYAHTPPSGERLALWRDTMDPRTPILGNRGPEIARVSSGDHPGGEPVGEVWWTLRKKDSVTLRIHGGSTTWEGYIAHGDNSLVFESSPTSAMASFADGAGRRWRDVLFFDEPEDSSDQNAFLSIFSRAGRPPEELVATWD